MAKVVQLCFSKTTAGWSFSWVEPAFLVDGSNSKVTQAVMVHADSSLLRSRCVPVNSMEEADPTWGEG